jgi:hypothetical protein
MTITLGMRFQILERDSYTCRFCGKRAPETELEVDHVMPRSKGGSDDASNLVTACRDCNRGKGDRVIDLSRTDWNALLGKFFHTLCSGGRVQQQGQIIGSLGQGFYVVRFFGWFVGEETKRQVVHVSDIRKGKWALYESDESMREHYEGSIGVRSHENGPACSCGGEG